MVSFLIGIGAILIFSVVVINKSFWQKKAALRLPILVGIFYFLFSIPFIFRLSDNIHSPYGMLFGIFNLPVIYLFGSTGIVDKLELFFFKDRSIESSNIIFVGLSLFFWILLSFGVGLIVERRKTRGRP